MTKKELPARGKRNVGRASGVQIRGPEHNRSREDFQILDCLDRLKEIGFAVERLEQEPAGRAARYDAVVRLVRGNTAQTYAVECLTRSNLQTIHLAQNRHPKTALPLLLCAPAMSKPLAQTLREEGQEFMDTAGNAFLDGAAGFVWVEGRRAKAPAAHSNAMSVGGLKFVSVLLRDPDAVNFDYRTLARAADISLGTVGWIFFDLRGQGFVRAKGPRNRRLLHALDLLALWETGYAQRLRPKLLRGSFRPAAGHGLDGLTEAARREPEAFLVGGELGAALLFGGLRPETATLHIRIPWREAAVRLRLLPDPDGPVTLLSDFGAPIPGPLSGVAHPLFLRAELLLGRGRRLADAAETVLKRHLEPALRDHAQG